jgi:hypothetical protein
MTIPPSPSSGANGNGPVRDDVRRTVEHAREAGAGRVDGVAESIEAAASRLDDEDMTRLSGYVHDMASSLGSFADDLRNRSGDEMLQQVSQLARRNPALFLGGSLAIGFGLSRFAGASRKRDRQLPLPLDQARVDLASGAASTPAPRAPGTGEPL